MERRDFLQLGLAAAAAGSLVSGRLSAAGAGNDMAGGVYYTAESTGRWQGKAASHVPRMEQQPGADGTVTITLTTEHGQHGYDHYIVKHQLLDAGYGFLGEVMFDPEKDEPVSSFTLPAGYRGPVYGLSLCNKHDLWLNTLTV
jgi:superoxide reductase